MKNGLWKATPTQDLEDSVEIATQDLHGQVYDLDITMNSEPS